MNVVKTLTIKESTYDRLAALKAKDESFSDLLDRLSSRRGLEALRRMRGTLVLPDKEEILAELRRKRSERRFA